MKVRMNSVIKQRLVVFSLKTCPDSKKKYSLLYLSLKLTFGTQINPPFTLNCKNITVSTIVVLPSHCNKQSLNIA